MTTLREEIASMKKAMEEEEEARVEQEEARVEQQVSGTDAFEVALKPYQDALAHIRGLDNLGTILKRVAWGVAAVGFLGGLVVAAAGNSMGLFLAGAFAGVAGGVMLFALGSLISALGQVILALVNTAANTRVAAERAAPHAAAIPPAA